MREETRRYRRTASLFERILIDQWIEVGWDRRWSYPNMPQWLRPIWTIRNPNDHYFLYFVDVDQWYLTGSYMSGSDAIRICKRLEGHYCVIDSFGLAVYSIAEMVAAHPKEVPLWIRLLKTRL